MATSGSVFEVGGTAITDDQVVARLKITGEYADAALSLARDEAARQAASDLNVSISDEELQSAYDDFRRACNLHKADDTNAWLQQLGLTVEDVESFLEAGLIRQKIAKELVADGEVEKNYNENLTAFEYALVSHIVVDNKNAADELALSLKEEGEDFAALAKKHSLDKSTSSGGGYRGLISRQESSDLPQDVADQLFSASAGTIVGPFEAGDTWCIARVEENGRSELDEDLKESLRASLCEGMLAEKSGI